MHQVHGADVVVTSGDEPTPTCDALVTTTPGVALLARAADCVPVLLAAPAAGVVAAVHAGRPGLAAGVVPAAVARMREAGASDLVAWVGPHVCGACYEVPGAMRDEVAARVPESRSETSWGTPALDLGAGVHAQLAAAGVRDVRDVGGCTRETLDLPSYRRDGDAATRFAGVIWMVAP
jgi:YfiH family protein